MSSNKLECRKIRKPKIEKLRRARINSSLESLKEILLQNTISIPQGSRPTKLEKADIMEMTVRYVQLLQKKLKKPMEESPVKINQQSKSDLAWSRNYSKPFADITNRENVPRVLHSNNFHKIDGYSPAYQSLNLENNLNSRMVLEQNTKVMKWKNEMNKENENENSNLEKTRNIADLDRHWRPW